MLSKYLRGRPAIFIIAFSVASLSWHANNPARSAVSSDIRCQYSNANCIGVIKKFPPGIKLTIVGRYSAIM